jgi:hypothetical protein
MTDVFFQYRERFALAHNARDFFQAADVPAVVGPIFEGEVPQDDLSLVDDGSAWRCPTCFRSAFIRVHRRPTMFLHFPNRRAF